MSFQTRLLAFVATADSGPQSKSQHDQATPSVSFELSQVDLSLLYQSNPDKYPYLLCSSAIRPHNTQYDILLACPQYILKLNSDSTLSCNDTNITQDISLKSGFFESLETQFQKEKLPLTAPQLSSGNSELPFRGGWFVYLSYEMAAEVEPCLKLPRLPDDQPMAVAARCPAAIIFDKKNNRLVAVAETAYSYLLDEIEQDLLILMQTSNQLSDPFSAPQKTNNKIDISDLQEAETEPYLKQVERIKQYIIDGDIFQANLSRLWQVSLKNNIDDRIIFQALATHNPSSFAAMANLGSMTILSSSPERLVSSKNSIVETRPIAGTRRRDDNQQSDAALARELLSHPKEQAEHIMLIDLERNDLGRVCRPGSIEVNELMVLESWQHVHHIVSNVRGELESNKSPIDVLSAVFPGGTITGCPKVRCIEILAEMEQQARGAYTGSLGYINLDGSMDFNILIRTIVRPKTGHNTDHNTGQKIGDNNRLSFRAGGGIVSDSIAEKELEETRAKAKGLLNIFNLKQSDIE